MKLVAVVGLMVSILLVSCSGENLYDLEGLAMKNDFIFELVVFPEKRG